MNIAQQNILNNKLQSAAPSKAPWLGMAGALASALGAGMCCAGPFMYLVFGISAAGFMQWGALEWLQAPLTVLSVLCLIAVFWRLYISKKPNCIAGINRYLHLVFWVAVFISAVLLSYSYVLGWWLT